MTITADVVFETLKSTFSWDIGLFVHLATLGYVLGFLFKNQLILRVLVLLATIFYIIYYYAYPAEPLWGAILGSVLIMAANITGTVRLLFDQLPFRIHPSHLKIFNSLKGLEPGEFRRLMKFAELETTKVNIILTQKGVKADFLYFVIKGIPRATKGDDFFSLPSSRFIGEVGFVLDCPASATVVLPKGATYVRWERGRLINTLEKYPRMKQAFEAQIGRDMACKLAISEPRDKFTIRTESPVPRQEAV